MGFLSLIRSISSFTLFAELFLSIFFIDCSILSFGVCDSLKLSTGSIYYPHFQIYRFLTFYLVNTNIVLYLFDTVAYIAFDLVVHKRWNFIEKLKFLIISTWIPGFMCLIYYYIKFANSRTEADLFYTGVTGSSAFVAAVTVVIKQLKYSTSSNTSAQNLYKYGPILYLLVVLFLQLVNVICRITFFYSFLGLLFGWTYLRFFQKHTDGKRGDFRPSFAFVSFFPRLVQPLIAILANFIYAVFLAFKLCPRIEQQYEILSASSFSKDVPTVSFSDNERHKRMALHDLNARLATKHEPLEQWPSLFDEEDRSPPSDASLVRPAPASSLQPAQSSASAKDGLPDV